LIGHLIGMAFRYGFGGKKVFTHFVQPLNRKRSVEYQITRFLRRRIIQYGLACRISMPRAVIPVLATLDE
jgi:hypothetical protein